ncbi:SAV_2336 N-terminal domain-related protein [Streptomyces sp. NPDC002870]|uniref:SAV_2336 N-terminal domain-related protein n=1 Tax=Streptomyces sp. NPDC002870 TaxID=3364666 RepID=UPI00368B77A7
MPERVLRILQLLGEQTTAEELAEVLWLAERVPKGENAPLALALMRESGDAAAPAAEETGAGAASPPVHPPPPHEEAPPSELHAAPELPEAEGEADDDSGDAAGADDSDPFSDAGAEGEGEGEGQAPEPQPAPEPPRALSIRIAHPRSLSGSLVTARALRPLKRYRPNPRRHEIDEAATAARIAHTGVLDVVTRPGRERWLDLSLIVDDSGSMLLWQQLCTELHTLFERLGAFRQIRTWGLRLGDGRTPMLSPRPFGASQSLLRPAVLVDPSGRTMTLVISDGASPEWRTGAMEEQLARWASYGPTAVIHALPPRMWAGSALPVRRWSVHVPHPGAANSEWRVRDTLLPPELSRFTGSAVPVLEPKPRELAAWARTIVAGGSSSVLSLWDPQAAHASIEPTEVSSDQAVRQFRRTASPEAYRLAAHLAAIAPLTVPVMRLVAEAVPWSATTAHLSEVFLGGLMRLAENAPPDAAAPRGTRSFRHSQRVFSFTDEAADILLDAVPTPEVVETARQVSVLIGELIGQAPEFAAWLNRPDGTDLLPEHAQSFAWLGSALLQRLGLTVPAGPDWDEPPIVLEEEPRRRRNAFYLHMPYVGFSSSPRPEFPWQQLTARDPKQVGDYDLLGWAPTSGRSNRASGLTSVYLGRNADGFRAAVRRASPNWSDDTESSTAESSNQLVLVEATALGRFDHACLPALFDHEANAARLWTAASPVTTRSGGRALHLAEVVSAAGSLGVDATLILGQRLASALAHSHSVGVVHGRLSPRHILLTGDNPVIIGWHRATVDGQPPQPDAEPAQPADDLRALAAILAHAALGDDWPAPRYTEYDGSLQGLDEADWSLSLPPSSVDPAVHALIDRCLRGPADAPPTAVGVLALLRDRMPRQHAVAPRLRAWLSPSALELIDDAELLRKRPRTTGRREPFGAQVPVTRQEPPTEKTPSRVGANSRKWQLFPGSVQPPRGLKRLTRRPSSAVLQPRAGLPGPCVAVISPHHGSGRSTVAVQLASALSARATAGRGGREPVFMLPVHRLLGVFGYRLLDADPSAVTAQFPAGAGHMPSYANGWATLADSRGAQFLYGLVPANAVVRLDTSTVRRAVDWLRSFGTVVVDAVGTFLPPGDSLRSLLGEVQHVVVTTTARQEHLDAVQGQLDWLSGHGYERLIRKATVVLSDVDGPASGDVRTAGGRFEGRVRSVHTIPYDIAVHRRGLVAHSQLDGATRLAFDELGRAVGAALDSERPGRRRDRR